MGVRDQASRAQPMLASASTDISSNPQSVISSLLMRGGWTFEVKLDGIRALVVGDGETVAIRSRSGQDITWRYPDVVAGLDGGLDALLDGEIVVLGPDGRPDFNGIQKREAQASPRAVQRAAALLPATFVAFDVPELNGVSMRALSYERRRDSLDRLAQDHGGITTFPVSADGAAMWGLVQRWGLEGLIAKRNDSRYVGHRSSDWLKIKNVRRLKAVVTGTEAGKGVRAATFGALRLAVVTPDFTLRPIGKVGSGFTDRDLTEISGLVEAPSEPLIVEVEYLDCKSGQLRFPVFRGLARSATLEDCGDGQLAE